MYAFCAADDLAFLLADKPVLDTVKFGRFIAHFRFENGATISWEAAIEHVRSDGASRFESPWAKQADVRLHSLLGQRLIALGRAEWTLTLTFDGGEQVILHSTDGPHEAGTISNEALYYVF